MNFKEIVSNLKKYIRVYQALYQDKRTPRLAKVFLWMAIGYFFLPFDLIPDFIPVLGQLDDAVIIPALIFIALKLIPEPLYQEHYKNVFGSN